MYRSGDPRKSAQQSKRLEVAAERVGRRARLVLPVAFGEYKPPDFYAVFRGTYPSSRVVSSCANANECATLPQYFAVCKDYLHLFFNIVRPSLIRHINPSRLTANRRAILIGSCLKT